MNLEQAGKILAEVREFFEAGYKSSNKLYKKDSLALQLDTYRDLEKIIARLYNARESKKNRLPVKGGSLLDHCKKLINVPESLRSGNCAEMALLSAYYAFTKFSVPQEEIFIVVIDDPGDHTFCLIGQANSTKRKFKSLDDFCSGGAGSEQIIIDPWLNVISELYFYPTLSSLKLDKWTSFGKRISWKKDGKAGWFVPNGDYKDALFYKTEVEIFDFK